MGLCVSFVETKVELRAKHQGKSKQAAGGSSGRRVPASRSGSPDHVPVWCVKYLPIFLTERRQYSHDQLVGKGRKCQHRHLCRLWILPL